MAHGRRAPRGRERDNERQEDLKVAGFWSKPDDSDADIDSAGSHGVLADR